MHTVISHDLLIQDARLALVPHVGDPDGPDADPAFGSAHVKLVPQWLIQFLSTIRIRSLSVTAEGVVPWEKRWRARR